MGFFTTKCAAVPAEFYTPGSEREMLGEVVALSEEDKVAVAAFEEENIVLIYAAKDISDRPEQCRLLEAARTVSSHTGILASFGEGILTLVVKEGKELRFCNAFTAKDMVTALYYMFLALGGMQINVAASTLHFCSPLSKEDMITALTYFKKVELI